MAKQFYIRKVKPPDECIDVGITSCLSCPGETCRYDKKNKYLKLWILAIKLEKHCQLQSEVEILNDLTLINDWADDFQKEIANKTTS